MDKIPRASEETISGSNRLEDWTEGAKKPTSNAALAETAELVLLRGSIAACAVDVTSSRLSCPVGRALRTRRKSRVRKDPGLQDLPRSTLTRAFPADSYVM